MSRNKIEICSWSLFVLVSISPMGMGVIDDKQQTERRNTMLRILLGRKEHLRINTQKGTMIRMHTKSEEQRFVKRFRKLYKTGKENLIKLAVKLVWINDLVISRSREKKINLEISMLEMLKMIISYTATTSEPLITIKINYVSYINEHPAV